MRTEDLIVSLAAGVSPVRVLPAPTRRLAGWLGVMALAAAAVVAFIGPRADLVSMLADRRLATELLLVVTTTIVAGWAAYLSSVPGAAGARVARTGALVALGAWLAMMATRLIAAPRPLAALAGEPAYAACAGAIAVTALVPALMAWWQLRQAAVLQHGWSTGLAAAAALAGGAAAAQVWCPIDHAAHTLTWHAAPVVTMAAVAAIVAWARRRDTTGAVARD